MVKVSQEEVLQKTSIFLYAPRGHAADVFFQNRMAAEATRGPTMTEKLVSYEVPKFLPEDCWE